MSSEWQFGKLGDFIELKRGYDLPQAKRTSGPFPLVSSSGVSDCHSVPMVRGPGVVTGRYGTIGQVYFVEDDFWPLNTTLYVRDFKGNDPKFISYFLKTVDFFAYSDKAAVPGVNRNHLHEALGAIPDLPTQQEIARTLGVLDDRIALLRETNATLEAIAQALFKSWFVDFDPVRARMEGRAPEGMDEATAALFPDGFEDSELGLVPKGWATRTMADISTVGIGKTPPRKEQHWFSEDPSDVRWVSIRDMGAVGVYAAVTSEFLKKEAIEKFNIRRVPDNTVLMSFKMTIGRVAITDGEMTTNEAIAHFKLAPDAQLSTEYIYLHLKQFDFSTLSSTSSIADAVNSKTVREIPILMPSLEGLTAFQSQVAALFAKLKNTEQHAQTLVTLRDTLLPRLISGQLRLPEAEALLEEACA
ncbi:restriction endonuclease subunit S [Polaromonas naphthalenivorans]|uniref:Restriction modification system DNA specificity domain n=1 Tax=Polaromonas naphthalenivorans (strain CJ2) TaxID=365044 RepID=A1VX09_POLNA|nr:restriction endonuclease subunit S [Polaromonas naphthalenivorans]ABM40187.1 restriction modification system DNA specificity domain [Polaromonas naphthalenivorans CJ2]